MFRGSNLISFGDEDDAGVFLSKGADGGGRGTLAPAPSPGGSQHSQSRSSGSTSSNKRKASDMDSDGDRNNMTKSQRQKHHGGDYTLTQTKDEWYPACREFHDILAYLPHLWKQARDQLMTSTGNPPGIQHLLSYLQVSPSAVASKPLSFWLKEPLRVDFDALNAPPFAPADGEIPPESGPLAAQRLLYRSHPWAFHIAVCLQHALVNRRWVIRSHTWGKASEDK